MPCRARSSADMPLATHSHRSCLSLNISGLLSLCQSNVHSLSMKKFEGFFPYVSITLIIPFLLTDYLTFYPIFKIRTFFFFVLSRFFRCVTCVGCAFSQSVTCLNWDDGIFFKEKFTTFLIAEIYFEMHQKSAEVLDGERHRQTEIYVIVESKQFLAESGARNCQRLSPLWNILNFS